jgi:hypothetical protein
MVSPRRCIVFVLCTLILSLSGCAEKQPAEKPQPKSSTEVPAPSPQVADNQSPLVGAWHSVKLDGADLGNFISRIRYTFGADGSFTAQAVMTDGTSDTKRGTFTVHDDQITQTFEGASVNSRFEFRDGALIVYDPVLDSTVWFEKDSSSDK